MKIISKIPPIFKKILISSLFFFSLSFSSEVIKDQIFTSPLQELAELTKLQERKQKVPLLPHENEVTMSIVPSENEVDPQFDLLDLFDKPQQKKQLHLNFDFFNFDFFDRPTPIVLTDSSQPEAEKRLDRLKHKSFENTLQLIVHPTANETISPNEIMSLMISLTRQQQEKTEKIVATKKVTIATQQASEQEIIHQQKLDQYSEKMKNDKNQYEVTIRKKDETIKRHISKILD